MSCDGGGDTSREVDSGRTYQAAQPEPTAPREPGCEGDAASRPWLLPPWVAICIAWTGLRSLQLGVILNGQIYFEVLQARGG